jgi:hypothetical protein
LWKLPVSGAISGVVAGFRASAIGQLTYNPSLTLQSLILFEGSQAMRNSCGTVWFVVKEVYYLEIKAKEKNSL